MRAFILLAAFVTPLIHACSLSSSTNVLLYHDTANKANGDKYIEFLDRWVAANSPGALSYQALTASQIAACTSLASFANLRLFIQPDGDVISQQAGLGATGIANIKAFLDRDQSAVGPSSFVGSGAGAQAAASSVVFNTETLSTLSTYGFYPYSVEGSLIDSANAVQGSYDSSGANKYNKAVLSNGHVAYYGGGPVLGFNSVAVPSDSALSVRVYFEDLYGYAGYNIPAVWSYKRSNSASQNVLLLGPNLENNASGILSEAQVQQNQDWLYSEINTVSGLGLSAPSTISSAVFDTSAPHTGYQTLSCYTGSVRFCDNFNIPATPYGGIPQWQRSQGKYNKAWPWNVTFVPTLMGQTNYYGNGQGGAGEGFLIAIANTAVTDPAATVISQPFSTTTTAKTLTYYYKGKTVQTGSFKVSYTLNNGASWTNLFTTTPYPAAITTWTLKTHTLPNPQSSVRLKFEAITGTGATNYIGIDTIKVT